MTQTSQDADLISLRDAVTQLGRAIAVSDLAVVEASTAQIKLLIERAHEASPFAGERHLAIVKELDATSQDIETLLASRLRAFDMAIAAWRDPDPRS